VLVLDRWPADDDPAPAPTRAVVDRARADDGAVVDGPVAVLVADLPGEAGPEFTISVTVEGPSRPRLDAITYHFQLTRMAAQIATLVARTRHIERLERLGHTDALTGLPNRRALEDRLDEARALARPREALTLVMIDLDDFKVYNDTHGHPAGDDLLRRFAEALRVSVRGTDFVARYGGEEFCVLLPATSSEGARSLLDHLRIFLRSGTLNERVPFSAGIATWDGTESTPDLIDRADQALYAAKRAGKDRSEIA
jgi:diguanylate cyclase (GGDEF)-like protein